MTNSTSFRTLGLIIPVLAILLLPLGARAATPTCFLSPFNIEGKTALIWAGSNLTSVTDETGAVVAATGMKFVTPTTNTTYTYTFTGTSGATTCSTTVAGSGVGVTVTKSTASVSKSKSTTSSKSSSKSSSKKTSSSLSTGPISVSMLPLLSGGVATPGNSVPVAYVKVSNKGTATTSIDGFTLKQKGTASDSTVIGFSTSDDKGGSRTTTGGSEGDSVVKKGSATIPLSATLAPGQIRIFTLKAITSRNAGKEAGKTLMFDVTGVSGKAKTSSSLPLAGVTWTLSR